MTAVYVKNFEKWSGGGQVVVRNLRETLGDARPRGAVPLIARNWVTPEELRSGNFILMPQNAWPWNLSTCTAPEVPRVGALRALSSLSLRRARLVIRISEAIPVKNARQSTSVLHNVLDSDYENLRISREGADFPQSPFIAVVGSMYSYRNLGRLFLGFHEYRRTGGRLDLYVTGWSPRPGKSLASGVETSGLHLFPGQISRGKVGSLFSEAAGVIFPAVVEASPITLLEALAVNPNVQVSRIAGHVGILQFNGLTLPADNLFQPTEVRAITAALHRIERHTHITRDIPWNNAQGRESIRGLWKQRLVRDLEQNGLFADA